jgi:hypothetical protein
MPPSRRRLVLALPLLLLLGAPAPVRACCMVPRSWDGAVDQAEQNVVVLHHAGHEELILRVTPFFQRKDGTPLPEAADAAPPYVEWVVTVPSPPTGYRTLPAGVFREAGELVSRLEALAKAQHDARTRLDVLTNYLRATRGVATAAEAGLDVSAPVRVGPHEITEVKARGREALGQLNAYLAARGLPEEDPDHMAWFVDRGFTFLCIHVTPPPGSARLGRLLDLEPLQIGFETERPYYPAKFSSRQGAFAVQLTAITSRPVAQESLRAVRDRLDAMVSAWPNLWTVRPLPGAVGEAAGAPWAEGVSRWYVNAYASRGFNRTLKDGRPVIATWEDDVHWDLGGDADDMPGWYYGDRELSLVERQVREHGYAWAVLGGLSLLLVLGVRRRRRRGSARVG